MSPWNPATPLVSIDAVVLDTETTGLDPRSARVIEIGIVRIEGGRIADAQTYARRINPGVPIPAATTRVHGITDGDLAGAPHFAAILPELEKLLSGAIIVGHSIAYDLAILQREWLAAGKTWIAPRALDVRVLARLAEPSLAHDDLDKLGAWLGVTNSRRHSAPGDAQATAEIFLALVPRLRERGIRTLGEAEAASRTLAEREAQAGGGLIVGQARAPAQPPAALLKIDSFPYRHRVRDVMSAPAVIVPGETTLREVLGLVLRRGISSVLVEAGDGRIGIVTERDLLREIDASPVLALSTPAARIMRTPLQSVLADDFVYRAIGRIERLGIRHLAVRDAQGTIVGALTTRNLLRHRATTAIALGDEIDAASDAAALARAWSKLVAMASSLVEEGVDARLVAQVVSAEVCAMTRRAAELAEAELRASPRGPPPCAYAVLVLGSAGRGESLLAADQDNAIVFAEGLPDGPADRWLAAIGARMADILDAAGISYCKGGVMARNAVWRLSLDGWRRQIDGWIGRQRPQDLLNVDIFFDALVVHGDATLGQAITNYAFERAAKAPDFLNLLTELARDWRSPVGMLGGIKAGPDGRIDLKKGGLMPLFTAARVLAIRHGIVSRSTPERLAGVRARGIGSAEDFDSVIEAHRVLIDAILRQQLADAGRGVPLSPKVSVAGLDKAGKQRLRAALEGVGTMIGIVGEGRI